MTLCEIVMKLIGNVKPVGDSAIDAKRKENLQALLDLTNELVSTIAEIECDKNRDEASMREMGLMCAKYLDYLGISE